MDGWMQGGTSLMNDTFSLSACTVLWACRIGCKRCRRLYVKVEVLSADLECWCLICTVAWQWKYLCTYVCVYSVHTWTCRDALSSASRSDDSRMWKLSQRAGHHTQTCPSNTWSPWKQPSSKLAQGGRSEIMEDQTEPCLPGDVLLLKRPPSSLSFPVRQNETGLRESVTLYLAAATQNIHDQKSKRMSAQ